MHLDKSTLAESMVVVAHPDDEVLFFSSVMRDAGRILMCFPGDTRLPGLLDTRKRVIDAFPRDGIEMLPMSTPAARPFQVIDRATEFGLEIRESRARARYERAYHELREHLSARLEGVRTVFTHNPWGEYGHADHVLLHRVVISLAKELGTDVWCSNYVSAGALPLAFHSMSQRSFDPPVELPTDIELAHEVRRLYIAENCWTVVEGFEWFRSEWFNKFEGPSAGNGSGEAFPLHLLHWWGGADRPRGFIHRARRRFHRLLLKTGLKKI